MKTNEELKKVLAEQITQELEELFEHLEPIEEGAFQQVEALILQSVMSIGRRWLEKILNVSGEVKQAHARREGACGHRQRLVGIREKTVLTVMGKVTVRRPYYQCIKQEKEEKEQEPSPGHHGSAPFDTTHGSLISQVSLKESHHAMHLFLCETASTPHSDRRCFHLV